MADSDGLENRCPRKGTVGSNPTLSAIPCLTRPGGLMIDKGRRDIFLNLSDTELVRAGRPSMGLGRPESLVPIRGLDPTRRPDDWIMADVGFNDDKGPGPVQQKLSNPARSGRKQR